MAAFPFSRKSCVAALLSLATALALGAATKPAIAGHPVFKRTKPHMTVGIPAPQPPASALFRPTMIFSQPVSPATSGGQFQYVPLPRAAGGVAVENLELVHEGFKRERHVVMPRIRFSNNLHSNIYSGSPGGHVKVFSGGSW